MIALKSQRPSKIILIDDLRPSVLTHKYLDDTTLTEIILRDTASEMQHVADAMMEWSEANNMNVNVKKTKEMVLGRIGKESVMPVTMTAKPLQQVSEYKLLGVIINTGLKWDLSLIHI